MYDAVATITLDIKMYFFLFFVAVAVGVVEAWPAS